MDYALLYPLHPRNSKPSRGQRKTTKKMNNVDFASSKNSSKRSLNWLFSWSTDTLEPEFYILQEKSQNFRCQRSIRGKVRSLLDSSKKLLWQKENGKSFCDIMKLNSLIHHQEQNFVYFTFSHLLLKELFIWSSSPGILAISSTLFHLDWIGRLSSTI